MSRLHDGSLVRQYLTQ